MTNAHRMRLEQIGDELEGIARSQPGWNEANKRYAKSTTKLFAIAWDVKQVARAGTASAGV